MTADARLQIPTPEECAADERGFRRGYVDGYAKAMADMSALMGHLGYSRPREAWNVLARFHDAALLPWRYAARRGWCEPPSARQHMPRAWSQMRQLVFERDEFRCVWCGSTEELQCDHVREVKRGGIAELDNLRTLCGPCHRRRAAQP